MSESLADRLAAKFPADAIEWRVQSVFVKDDKPGAMVVPYLDARAVQARLDECVGIFGWQVETKEVRYQRVTKNGLEHVNGIACTVSLWDEDRKQWCRKEDGAPLSDIESLKGGFSDAFKRACVQWGIGRYLYRCGKFFAVVVSGRGQYYQGKTFKKDRNGNTITTPEFHWNPPPLPPDLLPPAGGAATVTQTPPAPASPPVPGVTVGAEWSEMFMEFRKFLAEEICGKNPTEEQEACWPKGPVEVMAFLKSNNIFASVDAMRTCDNPEIFENARRLLLQEHGDRLGRIGSPQGEWENEVSIDIE